ncbi:lysophospholipase-like protein 1 isoform X1 [Dermochelys coriacea]|uniref:lysophospholipase-like protein 1 isoform X1 n=1 Tax=Dermochelys coriacea TaxID=27794 RepID=UPI0018E74728|nr:lysophospholipase-like protein 1 isoform X1 [Dermochelys coriacea]
MAALRRSVVSPAGRHRASVILLHGSGDTGPGVRTWIKQVLNQDLVFQHIKVIYPTAPARYQDLSWSLHYTTILQHGESIFLQIEYLFISFLIGILPPISLHFNFFPVQRETCYLHLGNGPYTPMRGALSTVWFDRWKISNECPEHIESIDSMCQVLTNVIDEEVKNGISKNKIILGGFSMGGGMAMHLAYRYHQDVAGVFALSSFLNKTSAVYQALQKNESVLPELFQCHGTADELVLHSWGEETNKMLKSLGVATSFHSFPNLNHELHKTELEKLSSWIVKKLPVETAMSNE